MKAICADGTEIECENFKAIDSGVLLTKDRKRNEVIGFVPNDDLRYVVPEDVETEHERDIEARREGHEHTEGDRQPSDRERGHEREREGIAALRERLDRLEARVDLSGTDTPEPAPDSETDPLPDSEPGSDSEFGDDRTGTDEEGESDASGDRIPSALDAGSDRGTGTSGFDPVAVVAEQREREGASEHAARSESESETDAGTIDVGRSDPVATIARQGAESTTGADDADDGDEAGNPAPEVEDGDREGVRKPDAELQRVDGLGPTYADRLANEGIETLSDLEAADPSDVASIAEVSESRAGEWIEQAGELPA